MSENWQRESPILKIGKVYNIQNHWPTVILCNFTKIFELSLYASIFPQVKPLISPNLRGFVEKLSMVTNFIDITAVT